MTNNIVQPEKLVAPVEQPRDSIESKARLLDVASTVSLLHGKEFTMAVLAIADQIVYVDRTNTEVYDTADQKTTPKFLSAEQLKKTAKEKSGQKIKSASDVVKKIKAAGRDDLLVPVTRSVTAEYVLADRIDEALEIAFGGEKQGLLMPVIYSREIN